MPRSCKTQRRYGPGTINPAPNGRGFDCFLYDPATHTRHRSRQPDLATARAWIDSAEDTARLHRPPLTRLEIADAQRALSILPEGATLYDLARRNAQQAGQGATDGGTTTQQAVARFIAAKTGTTAAATVEGYRYHTRRLSEFAGPDTPLRAVTAEQIEGLLAGMTPVSRQTTLKHLAAFFRWCIAEAIHPGPTPTDAVRRIRTPEPPKGILTPDEAQRLLSAAVRMRPELVPYLAVGLFAGIRPAEIQRLSPTRIGPEYIILDGAVTKTASARTVPVRPNLRAWLEAHPPAGSFVAPELRQRHLLHLVSELCRSASVRWSHDCMRHSYATYAYEQTHDAALVASEMGHRGTAIFFRHYRALAHPGDGARYFSILP